MKRLMSMILALALVLAMGSFAIAEEKISLDIVVPGNIQSFFEGEDENNNYMVRWIEEQTGYDVNWYILPQENSQAKLNAMMASPEEVPDIVINGSRDLFLNYYNDEMIVNLSDYITDPADFFKNDKVNANAMGMIDGEYWAVATPGNQSSTTYIWWYNEAALKEAGIEVSGTTITLEEFDSIMYKLKEYYPDKIPLGCAANGTTTPWINTMQELYGAFGVANDFRVAEDGTLEYALATDDMKEGLQYLNKLYTDGILDPEFLVTTKETLNPKLINGSVLTAMFAWYDYTGTYVTPIGNPSKDNGMTIDPAWKYANFIDGGKVTNGQTMGSVNQHYIMVTYGCEEIEAAVDLIEFFLQPEYYDMCFYGVEGVDYYYDENGTRWRNPETTIGEKFALSGTQWYVYYYYYETAEQRIDRMGTGSPDYPMEWNMNCWYNVKTVPNPVVDMPPMESYIACKTDIDDVGATYFIKFVMGEYSFDQWDEYKAELEAVGLSDVLAELNEWYASK